MGRTSKSLSRFYGGTGISQFNMKKFAQYLFGEFVMGVYADDKLKRFQLQLRQYLYYKENNEEKVRQINIEKVDHFCRHFNIDYEVLKNNRVQTD